VRCKNTKPRLDCVWGGRPNSSSIALGDPGKRLSIALYVLTLTRASGLARSLSPLPPGPNSVAVTAPTGIAAVGVGGVTVHKFIGAGLCTGAAWKVQNQVMKSAASVARWKQTETLVVDEISMLDADLLDKMDHVGRSTRNRPDEAFGGIQLVVTGRECPGSHARRVRVRVRVRVDRLTARDDGSQRLGLDSKLYVCFCLLPSACFLCVL